MASYDDIFSDLMSVTSNASMVMGAAIGKSDTTMSKALEDSLKYLDTAYKEAQAYLTPFRVAGENSISTLNNFIGVNGKAAQQESLNAIVQPAMNAMIGYGPQIAQQAMGMFFGAAGVPLQQANQAINQSTANAIQNTQVKSLAEVRSAYQTMNNPNASQADKDAASALFSQGYTYAPEGSSNKTGTGKTGEVASFNGIDLTQNPNGGYQGPNGTLSSTPTGAGGTDLSGPFNQYMSQYKSLMNQDPAQFSNNLISTLMDPVSGAVTQATQGFTDSMMKYGTRAIDQSAASKGMLNSGRTLAELQDYGMGVAGQYIIPAMQNVLQMGMNAGTGQASNIINAGTNLSGQQTSLANQYMSSMSQGGASLAGSSISATQNALSNLLAQATGAATTGAGLAGQQGTTGSGYSMDTGRYQADNALLRGKVESDALNTIGQLQFLQDMGPYVNNLGAIPGISSGGGTAGNASAQHNAVDQQAQNYLRSGGGGGGGYGAVSYGQQGGNQSVSGYTQGGVSYMGAG